MDNFIEVYNNVFSSEYCKKVIDFYNQAEQLGFTAHRSEYEHEEVTNLQKDDSCIFIPDSFPLLNANKDIALEFHHKFWADCYKKYSTKYDVLRSVARHESFMMKIQKTKPGQGYHVWHCEDADRMSSNRLLTWTVYLNDDFEAGETEFLYQQYRYKPQQGDVVIFPAAFTHTHRGNPPIGGDKYIITGWVEF